MEIRLGMVYVQYCKPIPGRKHELQTTYCNIYIYGYIYAHKVAYIIHMICRLHVNHGMVYRPGTQEVTDWRTAYTGVDAEIFREIQQGSTRRRGSRGCHNNAMVLGVDFNSGRSMAKPRIYIHNKIIYIQFDLFLTLQFLLYIIL